MTASRRISVSCLDGRPELPEPEHVELHLAEDPCWMVPAGAPEPTSDLLDPRSGRPLDGGLYDERLFGPLWGGSMEATAERRPRGEGGFAPHHPFCRFARLTLPVPVPHPLAPDVLLHAVPILPSGLRYVEATDDGLRMSPVTDATRGLVYAVQRHHRVQELGAPDAIVESEARHLTRSVERLFAAVIAAAAFDADTLRQGFEWLDHLALDDPDWFVHDMPLPGVIYWLVRYLEALGLQLRPRAGIVGRELADAQRIRRDISLRLRNDLIVRTLGEPAWVRHWDDAEGDRCPHIDVYGWAPEGDRETWELLTLGLSSVRLADGRVSELHCSLETNDEDEVARVCGELRWMARWLVNEDLRLHPGLSTDMPTTLVDRQTLSAWLFLPPLDSALASILEALPHEARVLTAMGVTEAERKALPARGDDLVKQLRGQGLVTDLRRPSA